MPVWSPDGRYIAFASDRTPRSSIYRQAIDGSLEEELLMPTPESAGAFPTDWSRDGRFLLYNTGTRKSGSDLWTLPLVDRKPRPFLATQFWETGARFFPDGKWVAYVSNESGAMEVYVAPFGRPGKQRVSTSGGSQPAWRSDGKELFFLSRNMLMSVEAKAAGNSLRLSIPAPLFQVCQIEESGSGSADYDVTADGQRFLFPCQSRDGEKPLITVAIQSIDMARRRPQGSSNGAQFGGPSR
jgi:Tol biopolymer transport system component